MLRCLGNYKQQSGLRWIWKVVKVQVIFFLYSYFLIGVILTTFKKILTLPFVLKEKLKNKFILSFKSTYIWLKFCFFIHPRSYFNVFQTVGWMLPSHLPVLVTTMRVSPATRQREPITVSPTLARNRGSTKCHDMFSAYINLWNILREWHNLLNAIYVQVTGIPNEWKQI